MWRLIVMLIERIWPGNDYRNFHYLLACPETGEALAVDPLDWERACRWRVPGDGRSPRS